MRIALLGLGLIGGSIARALADRAAGEARPRLTAWSPSGDGPRAAAADGSIDEVAATPHAAIRDADLIVLAGPADTCLAALDELAGPWRSALADDAVITDVASSKSAIVTRASDLGLRFVGGHPMAGREVSGYAAGAADLFEDRPWVVVPGAADESAIERVEALARSVGARPVRMEAAAHDEAVAAISHLPLLVAAALVDAMAGPPDAPRPGWPDAAQLAATGWRDMTRLARGDVAMGSGMLATNAGPVAGHLRTLLEVLEGWLADLDGEPAAAREAIETRLRRARERLETLPR
jgi:prephenate dehydrogenase